MVPFITLVSACLARLTHPALAVDAPQRSPGKETSAGMGQALAQTL